MFRANTTGVESPPIEPDTEQLDFNPRTHNGEVTIHNPRTGNHRTFRIQTQSDQSNFMPGCRIVSLLTGSDNETNYTPFGFANERFGVTVWKKYQSAKGQPPTDWERYRNLLNDVAGGMRAGLEYHISGACRRCNALLTTPRSIRLGIGPTCEKRENQE